MSIIGIPNTRVSDSFVRARLLNQVQSDQLGLFRLQTQLSTGRRFELPSEDPIASQRIISMQRLLERRDQIQSNISTNQSYLNMTDAAMSQISGTMAEVRGNVISVIGTVATDLQRQTAAQQVEQAIKQLIDSGNQKFRGRYLFSGSQTATQPFVAQPGGVVRYDGNEQRLSSFANLDLLFDTNLQGNEVFGAISDEVRGRGLEPAVTRETRLDDLRGGQGISRGKISIRNFDTGMSSEIDLSGVETIGDLAEILHASPPQGNDLEVDITPTGLTLSIDSGTLVISDVGSGTAAAEMGIRTTSSGSVQVSTADLKPRVTRTTRLEDLLGHKAMTVLRPPGADNDIIFQAEESGERYNDVTISVIDNPAARGGQKVTATYDDSDPANKQLIINLDSGRTEAREVVAAVNAAQEAGTIPFRASLDPLDDKFGGTGLIDADPATTAVTKHGTSVLPNQQPFDLASGLEIVNGKATHVVTFAGAVTVEDMLNAINDSPAGVVAEINEDFTGINVRSRLSGCDFSIGENGGQTATHLGLRTFTAQTQLSSLNFGYGVNGNEGPDFTVRRNDGVEFEIDLTGEETIQQVLDLINNNAVNLDPSQGSGIPLRAQLAASGNGIELVDDSIGASGTAVIRNPMSVAAIDLGLIPPGQSESSATTAGTAAQATLASSGADTILVQTAGGGGNGVRVVVEDASGGPESIGYDGASQTLTIRVNAGATTQDVMNLFATPAAPGDTAGGLARSLFTLTLTGAGADAISFTAAPVEMTGVSTELKGTDVNSQETDGLFTALSRLRDGLLANDARTIERGLAMLDEATRVMTFSRAELGTRQQALDVLGRRLETEEIELRETLSIDYDVDFVDVISNLTARQAAYEASLRATGAIAQMTLLSYL